MLKYTNNAGYKFVWPDYSDMIEVWHAKDPFDQPLYALPAENMKRNESALKKIANETAEFAKF